MGWTEKCQKVRFFKHSLDEWTAWIASLRDEGFGRYTKQGWADWLERMKRQHLQGSDDAAGSADAAGSVDAASNAAPLALPDALAAQPRRKRRRSGLPGREERF